MSPATGPDPGSLQRIFGSGPAGTLASLVLLGIAAWLHGRVGGTGLGLSHAARYGVLAAGSVATVLVVVWSVRSLPVENRGRSLCTTGAFAWVRHPLYAAFLDFFCPALAIFLDDWIYLLWAAGLHPLWHGVIRGEEKLMEARFGTAWRQYAQRTGRFVPRPGKDGATT